jgi:hypothetical protein
MKKPDENNLTIETAYRNELNGVPTKLPDCFSISLKKILYKNFQPDYMNTSSCSSKNIYTKQLLKGIRKPYNLLLK